MDRDSDDFIQFVNNGFGSAAECASLEEAITFAFEDFNSAVASFERIHGKLHLKKEDYLDDENFFNFVFRELDDMASWASTEELASWSFGSIQGAHYEFNRRSYST